MPKRDLQTTDLHAILGLPVGAGVKTIRDAYRRLALQLHPDAGRVADAARFRDIHDAYVRLSEQARRRAPAQPQRGDMVGGGGSVRSSAPLEEIKARGPVRIPPVRTPDDFETVAPSLGEILDHVAQNFFGFHQKSGGPYRRLTVEIVLSPEEAAAGGGIPFEIPCYETCPQCHGGAWMWGVCPFCYGYRLTQTKHQVALGLPAGIANGSRYEVTLDSVGISNLTLDVTVLVA